MMEVDPTAIKNAIASLIDIRRTSLGCEVQLPLFYPDGGSVSITVTVERGEYIVHDAGNGSMVLSANGIQMTRNLSQKIVSLAKHYGCEFAAGRVERRCSPDDIGVCVAIVANASRAVGDQVFSRPTVGPIDFRREVLSKVRDFVGGKRFRENEEVFGESGYSYQVSAVVLDHEATRPISFIEPIKDHEAATKKFREFWDISRSDQFGGIRRISLFDDKRQWDRADLIILQEVSNLVRVSDTEARMREIVDAR